MSHLNAQIDEGKPICQRCERGGHNCQGYPHPLRIVFAQSCSHVPSGSQGGGSASKVEDPTSDKDGGLTTGYSTSHSISLRPSNALLSVSHGVSHRPSTESVDGIQEELTTRSLLWEPGPLPTRDGIYLSFLVNNLLLHADIGRGLLLGACEKGSPMTDDSTQALAMAFYGRVHHQVQTCQQAAVCYGKALRKLSRDLTDPDLMYSSSIVLTTTILALYEMVTPTQMTAWIQHAGGVGHLIKARGPWRHQSPEELVLLESVRPMIAARAYNNCTRCFLEQPDWMNIPWVLVPNQKSSWTSLVDIFCTLPGFAEDRNRLKIARIGSFATSAPNTDLEASEMWSFAIPPSATDLALAPHAPREYYSRITILRERLINHLLVLQEWKILWDVTYPSAVSSIDPASLAFSSYGLPSEMFGSALNFSHLLRAREFTLYSTILFSLLSILFEIEYGWLSFNPSSDVDPSPLPRVYVSREQSARIPEDLIVKRRQAALDICRAVPYHLLFEKHGCGGAYLMLLRLKIAQQHFTPPWTETPTSEACWIKGVFRHVADVWGLGFIHAPSGERCNHLGSCATRPYSDGMH